jgi:multimeric flavodoxin WrbA
MKILALNGSNRLNGNTARTLSLFEEAMRRAAERVAEPLDFEMVNLGSQDIRMCQGCRVCFDRGEDKCPLKDDLLAVKAKMKAADGIIVATPVYVNDVNGVVKNWIDRMAHVCHRPEFAGKCVYLLATVASGPTYHALMTLNMAMRTWGIYLAGQAGFKTGALSSLDGIRSLHSHQIDAAARTLFRAVHSGQAARPSFFSLMTFRIQQHAWNTHIDSSLDYRYWRDQGWLDRSQTFYIPHRAGWLKVALARLAGALLAPLVS